MGKSTFEIKSISYNFSHICKKKYSCLNLKVLKYLYNTELVVDINSQHF